SPSTAGQRPCVVIGNRECGQPGDLVQQLRLQGLRVQAAAQPDATRAGQEAVRVEGRVGSSAGGPRSWHRGDRGGRGSVPERARDGEGSMRPGSTGWRLVHQKPTTDIDGGPGGEPGVVSWQ